MFKIDYNTNILSRLVSPSMISIISTSAYFGTCSSTLGSQVL